MYIILCFVHCVASLRHEVRRYVLGSVLGFSRKQKHSEIEAHHLVFWKIFTLLELYLYFYILYFIYTIFILYTRIHSENGRLDRSPYNTWITPNEKANIKTMSKRCRFELISTSTTKSFGHRSDIVSILLSHWASGIARDYVTTYLARNK